MPVEELQNRSRSRHSEWLIYAGGGGLGKVEDEGFVKRFLLKKRKWMEKTGMLTNYAAFFSFKMDILKLKTRVFGVNFLASLWNLELRKSSSVSMGSSSPIHVVHVTRSSLVHGLASSLLGTQCTLRGAKFQSLEAKENVLLFVVFFFSDFSSRCVYITSALV